ncbi:hypothetical protein [Protaetiibacter larvae]|uniref:Uncharacterized protein n=1 Tax=Protaetiibacter larvae TaxID=2592654 RepID=A0A5C1Y966_9MICO|nr:hypothetical protein [Protaetiibacter larvae]QEO10200.1 hypothetical protein FLP23_09370 [Protaetiibacter larvae]
MVATAIGYPRPHRHASHRREHPHHPHHVRGGLVAGGAVASALLLAAGIHAPSTTSPVAELRARFVSSVPGSAAELDGAVASLRGELASAELALEGSEARVLDEAVRTRLEALISRGTAALRAGQLAAVLGAAPDGGVGRALEAQLRSAEELAHATSAVDRAVDAWEAEQARIAAEREAAQRAAEAAAAAAAHPARARTGAPAPAGRYVEGIWTSGGQAEIDACRGSVNIAGIAGYLGGAFYAAEHWSCGGRAWAGIGTGAQVEFPGYGVYQVAGQVGGLVLGADASMLPAGYDGYYQTCIDGSSSNMHVWLLTRVA